MASNNFLQFCGTDTGTNLESQADYAIDPNRVIGNQPGIASSKFVNKAIRQSAAVVSQLAQYVSNKTGQDMLDDGNMASLLAKITQALTPAQMTFRSILSGSGTYNISYVFTVSSANATIGATFTNGGNTYTVLQTLASGTTLWCSGSVDPSVSGTLTKASGSGDATITFTGFQKPTRFRVRMIGAGGGGSGSGTGTSGGAGGLGGDTTFGTTYLTASGGGGGSNFGTSHGGNGGSPTVPATLYAIALQGGCGAFGATGSATGGSGAASPFGGQGASNSTGASGIAAIVNSGSGGGGGGTSGTLVNTGGGGGAGAYIETWIYSPSNTYAYSIGAAGTAGAAGTSGVVGGAGGSGAIYIEEFYN